jgi:hypothetical protein
LSWSKKTDELVRYVASRCRPSFRSELGSWLDHSPRFQGFVASNQDKVRKKLTTADGEEARLDVRSELVVAYLLLADRRFDLVFEAYGARRAGPDFTVTYRANQRFNLEVTRIRAMTESTDARLANVIAGKLRQLPASMPNALLVATGLALGEDDVTAATRLLKSRSDARDDDFFARRGLQSAREFYAQYLRLSGVLVLDERTAAFCPNREARHPLPSETVAALTSTLTTGRP